MHKIFKQTKTIDKLWNVKITINKKGLALDIFKKKLKVVEVHTVRWLLFIGRFIWFIYLFHSWAVIANLQRCKKQLPM